MKFMLYINKSTFVLACMLSVFIAKPVFAGTGQIFSPSGLPQSSTQTYTPPAPGNTPTVAFPTPPLPLGAEVLQNFPSSSLPLSNSNPQQNSTGGPSTSTVQQPQPIENNNVETFFQCNPPNTLPATSTPEKPKQSLLKSTGKVIWHTLDNLGVPMFVGKDNDLDPSLKGAYVMPSPAPITKIIPASPQRIPESELEGTDEPPKNDQTLPLH